MDLILVVYVVIGVIIGLVMGALPGLTVTMTMVLVVSLTYGMEMVSSLAFIIGAFSGGVVGGCISAIALNIPGTAAAIATVFDGYPMKQKGEADIALGIALFVSLLGAWFGILFLGLIGPPLADLALNFGSQEYFLLTVWGLTLVAILSKGRLTKGIISACFGLFVGMIGMDPITGLMRYTFNQPILGGGINYVVTMVGLFGMKEVFVTLGDRGSFQAADISYHLKDLLPKWKIIKRVLPCLTWSSVIGAIIGLLPGTGGDIGALVSYGVTKQLVKNPSRPFGEGAWEGVAAPEVANDAAMGGALTTMLVLGIPGDAVTAVILGSFYMHGLIPGPTFLLNGMEYFYLILIFLVIGTLAAYLLGMVGSNVMLRMLRFPRWYLIAFISILCVVGSYALQNNVNDILFMILFGIIGYVFEKAGYPVGPVVLGILLGPMIETNFRQALLNTGGLQPLIVSFFTRPISLVVVILVLGSFVLQSSVMSKGKS